MTSLLSRFAQRATPRRAGRDYVSPAYILWKFGGDTMARVVEGVLDGRIPIARPAAPHGRGLGSQPGAGLNAFVVELEGAMTIGGAKLAHLSVSATARRLKIGKEHVLGLLAHGFLAPSDGLDRKGWALPSVTVLSVEAFERGYVTASEIRRTFPGVRVSEVIGKLCTKPLIELLGNSYIYERSAIDELREIINSSRKRGPRRMARSSPTTSKS